MATKPDTSSLSTPLDILQVREDFPILSQLVYDKPLVYFDSAASAQKPKAVIDAIKHTYEAEYANVHRGDRCHGSGARYGSGLYQCEIRA